ncbi:FAD binding domain protein [Podospora appendiculata]|uniref:FAD binding domain protein n=1 Tax=Podospora appendiculata TaxID=314037 RepID=A0AAE0XB49_9PEZI|nr:FAD binding domain protein [Podospora appendiculata]
MTEPPKSVVIVGGSLAGLMCGIQLKRQGSAVTILEQDSRSERMSHAAGISLGANIGAFLREHDDTKTPAGIPSAGSHISRRTRAKLYSVKFERQLTSWGLLYRILRANLDGLATSACPNPPAPRPGDGKVEYRAGKRVSGLQCDDASGGKVTVLFEDVATGKQEAVTADLVVGADGIHSTVRRLVHAPVTDGGGYAGYVVWRGLLREKDATPETAAFFAEGIAFQTLKRSYMVCYIIPTDDGGFGPGDRLINWVWYYNVADGSREMHDIFTDVEGVRHNNTVPAGLVNPQVWERCRESLTAQMTAPFAEIVRQTAAPFVTKVNDVLCTQSSFHDGRVVLVGDAFACVRPHFGLATDHAAFQCLAFIRLWNGEVSRAAWSREVLVQSKKLWFLSILLGRYGLDTWASLLRTVLSYLVFLARWKLGWQV